MSPASTGRNLPASSFVGSTPPYYERWRRQRIYRACTSRERRRWLFRVPSEARLMLFHIILDSYTWWPSRSVRAGRLELRLGGKKEKGDTLWDSQFFVVVLLKYGVGVWSGCGQPFVVYCFDVVNSPKEEWDKLEFGLQVFDIWRVGSLKERLGRDGWGRKEGRGGRGKRLPFMWGFLNLLI